MLIPENAKQYAQYYRDMLRIRYFEDKVMELLGQNLIEGGSHLYAGEEAVAVGACAALREDDYITSTHRGHGHCIAKGGNLREMMAEIFGKATGCCKGKGGSLHIADLNLRNLGANGIVGAGIPIATGAGLSILLRHTDQVVLCFFGDGAANQGTFHESLNLAAVWKLPVVYICENNLYAMSGPARLMFPTPDIASRAAAYALPWEIVDGMDVLAVQDAVYRAVERARRGEGASLIECKTYRYYGHSRSDPRAYRTREEESSWRDRDPIALFREKLLSGSLFTPDQLSDIESNVQMEIEDAVKFALDSPLPLDSELYQDLFA
ncbi:MAG: thiamine pyrophosphate-dependent dehydrogenase E1 component subunit alpha [Chloroflexota bacterium]